MTNITSNPLDDSSNVSAALASWVADLEFDAVPRAIIGHLKLCLIDAIGCGLYGASQRWGSIASDVAVELSGGKGGILFGREDTASPSDAALANGTAVHGFEIDDIHVASSCHPGAVTVPVLFALANARRANGRKALTALAAGYESGLRVGVCAGISHSTSGFHVTGTVGTICSSMTAARRCQLSVEQSIHALGIGATQAGGLYGARMGAMTKRFHAGRAAQSGVLAALLAERGFTGATEVLEAKSGAFLSTLKGQHDPVSILEGLGERWETSRVGFKAYAACASAHTTIDAVRQLMQKGLRPDTLRHLKVGLSKKGYLNVGWKYRPNEVVTAQMNGSYAAAVTLLEGETFVDQYRADRLADPSILDMIERIEMVHEPALDLGGAAKRHAVNVRAELKDGQVLDTYVEQRTGSAEHPLSEADIKAKIHKLGSALGISRSSIAAIYEAVDGLEHAADLNDLNRAVSTARA